MKHISETWRKIGNIVKRDPRYKVNAYTFVMSALEYTVKSMQEVRHVTGGELVEGIRRYSLQQFGPMAKEVFNFWGVHSTEDFGNIVFNLVDEGLVNKTEEDRLEDFTDVYNFKKVFEDDYYGE